MQNIWRLGEWVQSANTRQYKLVMHGQYYVVFHLICTQTIVKSKSAIQSGDRHFACMSFGESVSLLILSVET